MMTPNANDNAAEDARRSQEAADRDEARAAAIVAARKADIEEHGTPVAPLEEHGTPVAPVEEQPAAPVAETLDKL